MLGEIQNLLKENACEAQAQKMSAYMKGYFAFAGIPRPKLLKLAAPIFKASAKNPLDWNFVFDLWQEDFREAQYIALEYIGRHHKELVSSDIDNLKSLIVEKSWWETADTIDGFVGELVLKDASLKTTMLEWASDRNLWLRRVAIDFQQRYKDLTDVPLLEKIICLNFGSGEFFINVCALAHALPLLRRGKDWKGWRSQFRSVAKECRRFDAGTLKSLFFCC